MDLEANPEELKSIAEHQEVPKKDAAVTISRALKVRYGDCHLGVGRRRQLKKRTPGDGGCRKTLAAVRRRMTRRVIPTRRKGRGHKGPTFEQRRRKNLTRDNFARGTSKGRTFG
jgi:hypothetical protein